MAAMKAIIAQSALAAELNSIGLSVAPLKEQALAAPVRGAHVVLPQPMSMSTVTFNCRSLCRLIVRLNVVEAKGTDGFNERHAARFSWTRASCALILKGLYNSQFATAWKALGAPLEFIRDSIRGDTLNDSAHKLATERCECASIRQALSPAKELGFPTDLKGAEAMIEEFDERLGELVVVRNTVQEFLANWERSGSTDNTFDVMGQHA